MIKTKVAFLESQLFSSHSELFENFSIALLCWIRAGPPNACLHDQSKSGFFEGPAFF